MGQELETDPVLGLLTQKIQHSEQSNFETGLLTLFLKTSEHTLLGALLVLLQP